jgi:HD superfamily phosphohydrolase
MRVGKGRMARGYFDSYRGFRDPIHGFIKVYDVERDIINTRAFQRLRRIKQLGLTCLVYHGADHTRFAHSLGVMELATRVFEVTISKDTARTGDNLLKWKEEEIQRNKALVRLVALLHDIGHAPFSHSSEQARLFPNGLKHEDFSAKIITEDSEIKDIISGLCDNYDLDITIESVANFLLGKEPEQFLQQIINGPFDSDKMDYLWRDSYYAGVHYGRFDIDRLINTFVVVYDKIKEGPALGIEIGGLYAAEAMMLARYYMFLQVYFHEIRRAYDLHLIDFLKTLLPDGRFPLKVEDYLSLDDYLVFHRIREEIEKKGDNKNLAEIIFNRKHFEKVKEHPTVRPTEKEVTLFEKNYEKLNNKFPGIKMDKAEDAPNKFKKEFFYLREKDFRNAKDKWVEITNRSEIVKQLEQVTKYRLYAPDDKNLASLKKEIGDLDWNP